MTRKAMGVKDLRLKFPGASSLLFTDLSLAIEEGEKVLLLGPSGCGKSTLLQVLSGMIPQSIDIPVKAEEVSLPESWGFLFQDPDTQFCMPFVDEELAFVLENLCLPQDQMHARIEELLHMVGLRLENPHIPIQSLSQGMKQRLALASVLALKPNALFLDEPTALLDPSGTIQIWQLIKQLDIVQTVVIVEHKINEIIDYVDRVILLSPGGNIVADAQPETLFTEYRSLLIDYGIWYPDVWEDYSILRKKNKATKGVITEEIWSPTLNIKSNNSVSETLIQLNQFMGYRGSEAKLNIAEAEVTRNDWIAITGENGAGKSTLLLALMQLIKTSGSYLLKGSQIEGFHTDLSSQIGYVFQNPEFQFVTNSVYDELAYSLKMMSIAQKQLEGTIAETITRFELDGKENVHPYQLSMGQKRRLSVATAMIMKKNLLLLDEPTFGQDAKNTFAILEQLEQLRREGTTIIMVTHDMEIVKHFATKVWIIEKGTLAEQLKPIGNEEEQRLCKSI
ncbi:ABC transporter ATP-binding protein [Bacillus horti]